MGSIRKRGDKYRAEVRRKGLYRSQEFRTKAGATAWITQVEAEYIAGVRGDHGNETLGAALDRYARDVSPRKRGHRWEGVRLVKLKRDFGTVAHIPLSQIRPQDIATWRDKRLTEVSPASVHREWNLLRSVFSVARREWGWILDNPMKDLSRPPSSKPRRRRVTSDDVSRIYRACGIDVEPITPTTHAHRVALAFELAIETGMRAGEIRTLEPDQIDLARGICRLSLTKNGDSRDVPLSSKARALLERLRRPEGPLLPMSAGTMDSTFRRLRTKAKIAGLHFHDSRAEAATRLSKIVDVLTLARILGHRDLKSLMVYYRESAEDIARRLG